MREIRVEWFDSTAGTGWVFLDDFKEEPVNVITLGFLIRETEDVISIAQNFSPEVVQARAQVNNTISIPKCSIFSIKEITDDGLIPVLDRRVQTFSLKKSQKK